ncbi:hypothetical protein RJ639_038789 [Escallonia herrerae]|uniref:Protein DEFECTIVE KERNEL 1 n=1 Tax=Escallonia herrerae TaxID=1293975 RepID=A0AA88WN49_9ASTE|nr:hypothetical protein RJ639_038789 [Escallonia herrerae]
MKLKKNPSLSNYGAVLSYKYGMKGKDLLSRVSEGFESKRPLCARASHLGLLYLGSLVVLLVYAILYGLTAKESHWLGAITSAAVIILVVASVLLGAAVSRHLSVTNPLAARRDALQSTVIRLREGFRRKEQNSSSSSSEGCGSSVKRSSSAEAGHLGNGASCTVDTNSWNNVEGLNSEKSIDSGRPSLALHSSSSRSVVQEPEIGMSYADKNFDHNGSLVICSSSGLESQGCGSSESTSANQQALDFNLALAFQEKLNDPRITSMLKRRGRQGDIELTNLLQDKGLDPNFAVMLKENGLDPRILALLQRSSLDADRDHRDNTDMNIVDATSADNVLPNQISLSEELRLHGLEKWLHISRLVLHHVAGTPERAWVLFSLIFIIETVIVAIFRPKTIKVINATHQQFEFGFAVLLLSPVVCSIMAFLRTLQAEDMGMTSKPRKAEAATDEPEVGKAILRLDYAARMASPTTLTKGLIEMEPQLWFRGLVAQHLCRAAAFFFERMEVEVWANSPTHPFHASRSKHTCNFPSIDVVVANFIYPVIIYVCNWFCSKSSVLLGLSLTVPLMVACLSIAIPIWIRNGYQFWVSRVDFSGDEGNHRTLGMTEGVVLFICISLFTGSVLALGAIVSAKPLDDLSYKGWTGDQNRVTSPYASPVYLGWAMASVIALLVTGVLPIVSWFATYRKDDNWKLSRGIFVFVTIGLLLLLGAISAVIAIVKPWTVLLSPPIVVYSPRVLPVYVYDAHADCGENVSAAFLVLYGIALATEGWGVVASLKIYPPFAGAAVSAITLVVAFGFAVSRPCLTLEMMEDAVHFLSKETVIQAIARSATKTRNALSGTYSAPQRSASSAALLVGDPTVMRDRAGNFVLPRADVMKLRDRLRNEERAAGSIFWMIRNLRTLQCESSSDVGHRREMCAHARILALEEAIDTEWVYMWDKFGGYLLLLLGLTAKAERVQDEVRLRLFLDSIGFSDLSAKKIKKWMPEDRRQFEIIQESYIREKEMEEEILMQRREEEGRGKERRKALLEKEERKWKELEASLISSIPNAGSREAAAMAAAVRAVGGDSVLDDSFARERVSGIARRIRTAQLSRRALQTGISGAICVLDDEPTTSGRHCGQIDLSVCQSQKISFSMVVMIQPESGPVCLLGTEFQKNVCWEILVAGSEQGIEAGQVGLRLITKGDRQTTVAKEWSIGAASVADGRWHMVTMTIDADLGEATCYLDGGFDGYQTGLPLHVNNGIWEQGTEVWVGIRPPTDVDAFGRSDSEGAESKMHVMDLFLWGRCLSEDEIASLPAAIGSAEYNVIDLTEDNWQWADSPSRVDEWDSDPADVDLYDRDDVDWDGQYSSGRKRKSERDGVVVDVDSFARRLRKPRMETRDEINERMLSVELAVKEALSARGESNFTDQEFPPNDRSLFLDPSNPPSKLQVVSEWMRPPDIVKENHLDTRPCLFSGAANPSDVCQGEWVPVVVDDWIPCESPGKPAFATSRKGNELWVSLLEKAYAKLHGSYEALEGGLVQDALVDLTGGAGEEIDMRSAQAQIDLASGRLWSQLLRFKQEGFLLGAGSPSGSDVHISSSGIVQGHAYSLLQVREVDGHKLVQIRNPWANEVEWNGPWSDSSPEWTDRMKHKLKHVPQSKDGIFWMSWQDFQIHFRSIYVCRVYPPEMRYCVHGQWRGYSAGGCQDYDTWHQNPQFRMRATGTDASAPIHVFITLTQGVSFSRTTAGFRNYQSSHDSMMFYIGMRILKTRGRRANYNIYLHESVGGTDYVNSREISCEMVLEPDPKGYTIVPTTIHPGEEAPFVLSFFWVQSSSANLGTLDFLLGVFHVLLVSAGHIASKVTLVPECQPLPEECNP